MKDKEIDTLTKELLSKSAMSPSDDFEERIMMQITTQSVENSVIRSWYIIPFALLSVAAVFFVSVFIIYILPTTGFEPAILSGYFEHLKIDISLQYLPGIKTILHFSSIVFCGIAFLYFFDLFLSDMFHYKNAVRHSHLKA